MGSAEAIVDITSTGTTLKANGLRILSDGIILKSQANLVLSKVASLSVNAALLAQGVSEKLAAVLRQAGAAA